MNRIIFSCFFLLLLTGCIKEDYSDITFSTDLSLDSKFIILNAPADTTKIVVYSDRDWTFEPLDDASWATVQSGSGTGAAYAVVAATDNSANLPRATRFLVKSGNKTDTLKLGQRGIVPKITITATTVSAPAAGAAIQTAIDTSLPLDIMSLSFKYDANGQDWITNVQIADKNLLFNVAANGTSVARSAKLYLSYLDALGTTTRDSITVNQVQP